MAAKRRKIRKSKGFGWAEVGISFHPLGEGHGSHQDVQIISFYEPFVTFCGYGIAAFRLKGFVISSTGRADFPASTDQGQTRPNWFRRIHPDANGERMKK